MSASFRADLFAQLPVVGILRGFSMLQTIEIVQAAIRGGLKNIEITMNTADAASQIREAVSLAGTQLNVGAGTVTSRQLLDEAMEAGASFIVTPTIDPAVIAECVTRTIPIFPGAFSPTEVLQACEMGATMVKIFPAETAGAGYVRSLKAPLPGVKLMPTGGVDLKSLPDFIDAGADGFGVGSPLFDRQRIESGDWPWVEAQCRAFAEAYRHAAALHP